MDSKLTKSGAEQIYLAPSIQVITLAVERGFAASSNTPDSGDYGKSDNGDY